MRKRKQFCDDDASTMVTWVFWSLFKLLCWTLLFLVIVMVAPGIPPHNVKWNMLAVRI